jgi:hypothetical protein
MGARDEFPITFVVGLVCISSVVANGVRLTTFRSHIEHIIQRTCPISFLRIPQLPSRCYGPPRLPAFVYLTPCISLSGGRLTIYRPGTMSSSSVQDDGMDGRER